MTFDLTDQQRTWLIVGVMVFFVWWFMTQQREAYYVGRGPAPLRFSAEGYQPGRGPIPNRFYKDLPYLRNYGSGNCQPYY